MKIGSALSNSSALDEFLASSMSETNATVPKIGPYRKWNYKVPNFASITYFHNITTRCFCVLSTYWERLIYAWAAVVSPESLHWANEYTNRHLIVDMSLIVFHCMACVAHAGAVSWLWGWSCSTHAFCLHFGLIKYSSIIMYGPILIGWSLAHTMRLVRRESSVHQTLIRRCLILMRRSQLMGIGAISSYPLPPFTAAEESAGNTGSFATTSSLKSVRACIHYGLCQIRSQLNSEINTAGGDPSVQFVSDEANALFKGDLQRALSVQLMAHCKIHKTSSEGLCAQLSRLSAPLIFLWDLILLVCVLKNCQQRLLGNMKYQGIAQTSADSSKGANFFDVGTGSGPAVELGESFSRLLKDVNKLRTSHEWEATRLWNCELEIYKTIISATLDVREGSLEPVVIQLAKVVSFQKGLPVPLTTGVTAVHEMLRADDNALNQVPLDEIWKDIAIKLTLSINQYLLSMSCTDLLSESNVKVASAQEVSVVESLAPSADSSSAISTTVTAKAEYSSGNDVPTADNSVVTPIVLLEVSQSKIVDIFSGVVDMVEQGPVRRQEPTAVPSHKMVRGLIGELRHHVEMRIQSSGLLERENGGELVPLIISEEAKVRNDESCMMQLNNTELEYANTTCSLAGNRNVIQSLNSDLVNDLIFRGRSGMQASGVVFGCSSSDDDDS